MRRALLILAVLAVLAHCYWFSGFTVDDAAISFSYARSFAQGHGLVLFPGGERVEGYTNFLWVLLLGLGIRLGLDVFVWSHVLGAALSALTVLGVAELCRALRGRRSAWDAVPALLAASLLPIAYWAMSGLEGGLYCAVVIWSLQRIVIEEAEPTRRPLSALLGACAVLTRPDGVLLLGVLCALRLARPRPLRQLLFWLALAFGPVLLHLVWRTIYYAYPLPNTFYAKVQSPFRLAELFNRNSSGWQYVLAFCASYRLWVLIALGGLSLLPVRREPAGASGLLRCGLLAALLALAFFPIYARGDWMSEGRFLVATLPLLCALSATGLLRLCAYLPRPPMQTAALALLWLALAAVVIPNSLLHSKERHGHYPVPAQAVAVRGNFYRQVADTYHVQSPAALDGDLGGTSFYAGMPIIDLGRLADVTLARFGSNRPLVREYVYGERRPTFLRIIGFWMREGLQQFPEFAERYMPSRIHPDIYIERKIFLEEAIDTRTPLFRFSAFDLIRSEVPEVQGQGEVRLWLLVRQQGPALTLATPRRTTPLHHPFLQPADLRPGEVVRFPFTFTEPRPEGEPLDLCEGPRCVRLQAGVAGAPLINLPPPSPEVIAAARRSGDLELALVLSERARKTAPELGEELDARSRRALAAGDRARAFADARLALRADPARSWTRRRIELLRPLPRPPYPHAQQSRLEFLLREFRLNPTPERLGGLATLALSAEQPERAALAYLSTRLLPVTERARLDLAQCLLRVGLSSEAASLRQLPAPQP